MSSAAANNDYNDYEDEGIGMSFDEPESPGIGFKNGKPIYGPPRPPTQPNSISAQNLRKSADDQEWSFDTLDNNTAALTPIAWARGGSGADDRLTAREVDSDVSLPDAAHESDETFGDDVASDRAEVDETENADDDDDREERGYSVYPAFEENENDAGLYDD